MLLRLSSHFLRGKDRRENSSVEVAQPSQNQIHDAGEQKTGEAKMGEGELAATAMISLGSMVGWSPLPAGTRKP